MKERKERRVDDNEEKSAPRSQRFLPRFPFSLFFLFFPFSQAVAQEVRNPDTFVYAIEGEPESLDPHWEFDHISQEVQFQIYEPLIFYRGSSPDVFNPALSAAVPSADNGLLSDGGLTYAFPIRKKVHFHDGSTMTPEDARYSILRCLLTDRSGGPSYLALQAILGVDSTTDAHGKLRTELFDQAVQAVRVEAGALVIHLQRPYTPLLGVLSGFCPIVSKDWVVKNGGWNGEKETWPHHHDPPKESSPLYERANGTGPFKLERWDRQNRRVVLVRNDDYWRKPAYLQHVIFETMEDPSTRKLSLAAGDVDMATMDRTTLPMVQNLPGVVVTDDLPLMEVHNVFVYPFHIKSEGNPFVGSGKLDGNGIPPDFFSDPDVRRAFAYAFDYDGYVQDGFRGKAKPARGPIPEGVFGYNPQPFYSHDPAKAEEYFRKAQGGRIWDAGFRFTLTYEEGVTERRLACEIMKKNVEALNPKFQIDVRGLEWPAWLSQWLAGKIPMANVKWSMDYPDPQDAVYAFLASNGYYARVQGYSNPYVDRLIEQAGTERDTELRRQLYLRIQGIAYTDVPQIYTVDTFNIQVMRSWVKGWVYNPMMPYGALYPVYKSAN